MKYIILAVAFFSLSANACYSPKKGFGWDKEKLVGAANIIVIAELVKVEKLRFGFEYTLTAIVNLKGVSELEIKFRSMIPPLVSSEDFDGHKDEAFWKEDLGRSAFPCCVCGPNHSFTFGERYLLFPDSFGAMASAEAILSKEDKWLAYVKKNL